MACPLADVRCASLPADALGVLAALRREPGIRVIVDGPRAWVFWESENPDVLLRLLPVSGLELFERRGAAWHRPGRAMPELALTFDEERAVPLDQVVVPRALTFPVPVSREAVSPIRVQLVREPESRDASALICALADLAGWADRVPTARIECLRGAWDEDRVVVVGSWLPEIARAQRYWGGRVLHPLGWRSAPPLPDRAILAAVGALAEDYLVLESDGYEIVPGAAIEPMSRASIRRACREGRRS